MVKWFYVAVMLLSLSACGEDPKADCQDTDSAKIRAHIVVKTHVKKHLKLPNTAKFPWTQSAAAVTFNRECHFTVVSHVESENSFGGTVRTRFAAQVEASIEGNGHVIKAFAFE